MKIKLWIFALLPLLLASPLASHAATALTVPPGAGTTSAPANSDYFNSSTQASYNAQVQNELARQEQRVQKLMQNVTSQTQIVNDAMRMEAQAAITVLQVKRTLVGNLINSDVIQYAPVRDQLLAVLKQTSIAPSDLAYLQSVINQQRALHAAGNSN
jgi:hypothetical protein